jgi:tRNA dimethylallyltransferase
MNAAPGAPRDRALLLLGPTACGKSALSMRIAQHHKLEIVSIDSAQVYRGLDIGTAKPDRIERERVPHHLIDIRDPAQAYSAAEFVRDANAAIEAIRARGHLPLVVGGTMMYARALREGLAQLPSADPEVRRRIEMQARDQGWEAMHSRLAQLDPPTAARLARADRQRISRALEVFEVSGRPLSELLESTGFAPIAVRTIALLPEDRVRLHGAIERRFDAMLAQGFLDEVRALRARGDLHADLPSIRSVGYRQAWKHLEQGTPFEEFRASAIAATRQLAKRQITWLRSMDDAVRIDPFAADVDERVEEALAPSP